MTLPKPGDELKLRNGWPAKVLAVHPEQKDAIFGEYRKPGGQWVVDNWDKDGQCDSENDFDLMLPKPERLVLEGWVNFYPGCIQGPFKTEIDAYQRRQPHCIACKYLEFSVLGGEGL